MPPLTLLSPYSGRPVVVREQDLGRAIRDEQGRVFYVVEDQEHGRYASRTRKGSDKDLEHYRALQAGEAPAASAAAAGTQPAAASSVSAYDATGVKRRNPGGIIAAAVIVLLVIAGAYVLVTKPAWLGMGEGQETEVDDEPASLPAPDQTGMATPRRASLVAAAYRPDDEPSEPAAPKPEQAPDQQPTPDTKKPDAPAAEDRPEQDDADADADADAGADPAPVIVPNKTWRPEAKPNQPAEDRADKRFAGYTHTASGLRYKLTHRTDGPPARVGNYITVRYTAQTVDGESLIDDASQSFVLMNGGAIRAFDEGLAGVHEGEQLRLFVPRGHSSTGTLPGIKRLPDEPMLMDVQLVSVKPGVSHVVEEPGDADARRVLPGDTVRIHYLARVEGKEEVIDATVHQGEPMDITLGGGEVIAGLELGLAGMRPNETRLISIPPYLAYGETGAAGGLIPPNAVLSFRVTLVQIVADEPAPEPAEAAARR